VPVQLSLEIDHNASLNVAVMHAREDVVDVVEGFRRDRRFGLRAVFERLRARPAVNERFQLLLFADISIFLCLILVDRCPALARAALSDAQK